MPTQGWRITSSPTLPRTDRPCSSTTSAAMPGQAQLKPATLKGRISTQPTMPPEISVPPE